MSCQQAAHVDAIDYLNIICPFCCHPVLHVDAVGCLTASLSKWLRRPPRKQKVGSSNPACNGMFPGRVIPVT